LNKNYFNNAKRIALNSKLFGKKTFGPEALWHFLSGSQYVLYGILKQLYVDHQSNDVEDIQRKFENFMKHASGDHSNCTMNDFCRREEPIFNIEKGKVVSFRVVNLLS